jgi:spore germination protein GerM
MKIKKIYFIVIGILLIILGIVLWSYYNREEKVINNSTEIIPEEEISDEQLRNTIINLYFIEKETGEIKIENKLIDAKILMNDPYKKILDLWIQGPINENLKNNISKNVKINKIKLIEDCLEIDFSEEFINEYSGTEEEKIKTIYCLVNTLTELTEINSIKILINGEENKYLGNFNLSEKYLKINE